MAASARQFFQALQDLLRGIPSSHWLALSCEASRASAHLRTCVADGLARLRRQWSRIVNSCVHLVKTVKNAKHDCWECLSFVFARIRCNRKVFNASVFKHVCLSFISLYRWCCLLWLLTTFVYRHVIEWNRLLRNAGERAPMWETKTGSEVTTSAGQVTGKNPPNFKNCMTAKSSWLV